MRRDALNLDGQQPARLCDRARVKLTRSNWPLQGWFVFYLPSHFCFCFLTKSTLVGYVMVVLLAY